MIETIDQNIFLRLPEKYLAERKNIGSALVKLKEKPEILERIIWQLDYILRQLNIRTDHRYNISGWDMALLPNTIKFREVLKGRDFPSFSQLRKNHGLNYISAGIRTFQEANQLMLQGESGMGNNSWKFHQNITNTEDLTAAIMLELYGEFICNLYPDIRSAKVKPATAVKENLAINGKNTDLFIAARPYYTIEEGFSPQMVAHVRSIDETKLTRMRPPVTNPDYRIFEVKDPNAILSEDARVVFLGAQNPDQLMTEVKIQRALSASKAHTERIYLIRWEGDQVPEGAVVGGREIAWTQNGVVKARGGKIIGTYERIIECGGRYGDEQFMAIYLLPGKTGKTRE